MSLYLIATPIGNLKDITLRALEVLASVDLIAAEDTRTTSVLLNHYNIHSELLSYHAHNVSQRDVELMRHLSAGKQIALVSDAGTPMISDPGYSLVHLAIEAGITVIPIPGPSSLIAALSVSGLRTDRFVFEGFLPQKKGAREARLKRMCHESRTVVLFESTHRIVSLLDEVSQVMGENRQVVLAKELTKHFENVLRGPVKQVLEALRKDTDLCKGEFVLLIEGGADDLEDEREKAAVLFSRLHEVMSHRDAVALVGQVVSLGKNELYGLAGKSFK